MSNKLKILAMVGVLYAVSIKGTHTNTPIFINEPTGFSLYDIEVDVDDTSRDFIADLVRTRAASVGGWTVSVADGCTMTFAANGVEMSSGGVVARGKALGVPVKVTLTKISTEDGCILLKFKTGLIRVKLT